MTTTALNPGSMSHYVGTLRQVLDFSGTEPNPARHRTVKLPRAKREEPTPPTRAEVDAIVANVARQYRLPIRLMEATALRVSEALGLRWGDVDSRNGRLRVSRTRTKQGTGGQRFVQVPAPLMDELEALVPREDRTPDRPVFLVTREALRMAMQRGCTAAGITNHSPHSLRHRRLSLWHAQNVPARELAARAGHSRPSLSLDVYSHVVAPDDDEWA